jgi:hypothetical protein
MRDYKIIPGPETPSLPASVTPTNPDDTVNKAYVDAYSGALGNNATGTKASPTSITAGGGITPVSNVTRQLMYLQGSGGAVDITASPQIAAGTVTNQELIIIGCSDTNTLKLEDGTGLSMNGPHTLGLNDAISFIWDQTNWVEISRREN